MHLKKQILKPIFDKTKIECKVFLLKCAHDFRNIKKYAFCVCSVNKR